MTVRLRVVLGALLRFVTQCRRLQPSAVRQTDGHRLPCAVGNGLRQPFLFHPVRPRVPLSRLDAQLAVQMQAPAPTWLHSVVAALQHHCEVLGLVLCYLVRPLLFALDLLSVVVVGVVVLLESALAVPTGRLYYDSADSAAFVMLSKHLLALGLGLLLLLPLSRSTLRVTARRS